ncbi:MAG TPA: MBL fold metallo-hydrolase, partial [candidate division Zixibacteria bacterium]|nr:MBL fold metallo-hydrolase [candidate division Zixibacteria bacterium]
DAAIIAGHGKLATIEDVRVMRGMIAETAELVRAGIKSGKSLEEVKAAGLPEKWASWSWGFVPTERWLETLYRGLQ